jgi:hypothetical protein
MTVTVDQLKLGIKKFVENEIAYKATGLTKFLTFFMLPSIDKEVSSMVSKIKEISIFDEFFTPEGNIFLDEVYSRAIQAVDKSGKIVIEKFQLALDRSDLEKIYHYTLGS